MIEIGYSKGLEIVLGQDIPLQTLSFEGLPGSRVRGYIGGMNQYFEHSLRGLGPLRIHKGFVGSVILLVRVPEGGYSTQSIELDGTDKTITLSSVIDWPEGSKSPEPISPDPISEHYSRVRSRVFKLNPTFGMEALDEWHLYPFRDDVLCRYYGPTEMTYGVGAAEFNGVSLDERPYNAYLLVAKKGGEKYTQIVYLGSDYSEYVEIDVLTGEVIRELYALGKVALSYEAPKVINSPAPQLQVYTLEIQVTREGESPVTGSTAKIYLNETTNTPSANFLLGAGVSGLKQYFSQAILGEWYVSVMNFDEPKMGSLRWPTLTNRDNVLRFDLSEGTDGGNTGGDKGLVHIQTYLEGQPAQRDVVVVEQLNDGTWRMVGFGKTDEEGSAAVEVKVLPDTKVFGLVPDDFGFKFVPNQEVKVGERVRPSTYRGWLYQITEPGVLPETEPEWWPAIGDNASRTLGTARAIAIRYYQPLGHGPVPVELI